MILPTQKASRKLLELKFQDRFCSDQLNLRILMNKNLTLKKLVNWLKESCVDKVQQSQLSAKMASISWLKAET